jgi:hypothetical protein
MPVPDVRKTDRNCPAQRRSFITALSQRFTESSFGSILNCSSTDSPVGYHDTYDKTIRGTGVIFTGVLFFISDDCDLYIKSTERERADAITDKPHHMTYYLSGAYKSVLEPFNV